MDGSSAADVEDAVVSWDFGEFSGGLGGVVRASFPCMHFFFLFGFPFLKDRLGYSSFCLTEGACGGDKVRTGFRPVIPSHIYPVELDLNCLS